MALGICDQCRIESTFLDLYSGMRLKCKLCPTGFVTLPPRAGAVYAQPVPELPVPKPAQTDTESPDKYVPRRAAESTGQSIQQDSLLEKLNREYESHDEAPTRIAYRIAFSLILLGGGSVLLYPLGFQFKILAFLEPFQPAAGLLMAMGGAAVLVYRFMQSKK